MKTIIFFLLIISVLEISSEPPTKLLYLGLLRNIANTPLSKHGLICYVTLVNSKQGFTAAPCAEKLIVKKPSGQNEYNGIVELKYMSHPAESIRFYVVVDVQLRTDCKSSLAVVTVADDPFPDDYVITPIEWQKTMGEISPSLYYETFGLRHLERRVYVTKGLTINKVEIVDMSKCANIYASHNLANSICANLKRTKLKTKHDIGAPLIQDGIVIAVLSGSGLKKIESGASHQPLLFEKTAPSKEFLDKALQDGNSAAIKFRNENGAKIVGDILSTKEIYMNTIEKTAKLNLRKTPGGNESSSAPKEPAVPAPEPPKE